ncbi:hypothetical protein [Emcibacter sp. SYSU 3D8]|uniref:hypothetical protein n=1 Tax=Emcibacter sp. SYSU 3D8 TaxID=3133969 RepID=UPI0031FE63D8
MPRATRIGLHLLTVLLAACGSADDGVLVDACVREGGDKAYCSCRADSLVADTSDSDRKLLIKMTRLQMDENISAEEAQEKLFKEEGPARLMAFQFAMMAPLMKAEEKCR